MQWGIESVAAVMGAAAPVAQVDAPGAPADGAFAPGKFAQVLQSGLGELDASVGAAELAVRDLAAGKPVELHDVMISLERARLSVQTFVQVRNKLVESYQDLMRMQL